MSTEAPAGADRRAHPESFRARSLLALLTVNDARKSMEWYRDVLGFHVKEQYEHEGKLLGVSLLAGTVQLMLNQDDGAKGWDRSKGEGISLAFATAQDVDALAARIKERGGTLMSEPADMPWGGRLFRFRDPDGFMLAISSE
ncbi:MAG TPA: VOC family protein [Longimicrobium sp.]|jgi:uncharacterized glyoxalase superfamily protein PhnB|uniref:VOC family protein n=1 Tax=Longimicrobium sp. TaxID=2029185 RepID=UPI002EDA91C3